MGRNGKLSKAPLAYVLAQVKFESILAIDKYLPEFQERVRKSFPRNNQEVVLGVSIDSAGKPTPVETKRWNFNTKENTSGFIVQSNSIAFHATNYDVFDGFLEKMLEGVSAIGEIAEVQLVERIGLRYIDLVSPEDGKDIAEYICSSVLGFPYYDLEVERLQTFTQSVEKTRLGYLVRKYYESNNNAEVMPADLNPLNLTHTRVIQEGAPRAILGML